MNHLYSNEAEWTLARVLLYLSVIIGVYRMVITFNLLIFKLTKAHFWQKSVVSNLQPYFKDNKGNQNNPLWITLGGNKSSMGANINSLLGDHGVENKFTAVNIDITRNFQAKDKFEITEVQIKGHVI